MRSVENELNTRPKLDMAASQDRTGLFTELLERPDMPSPDLTYGFINYLGKQGVQFDRLTADQKQQVEEAVIELHQKTQGVEVFGARNFRYFDDSRGNPNELVWRAALNARYWLDLFGSEFFRENPYDHKKRNTFYRTQIDDDFYLSCKGGSGSGTFSLDFAIGQNDGIRPLVRGEIWRVGLDTEVDPNTYLMAARIIRSGGAMRPDSPGGSEKQAAYDVFKRRYGIRPNRALAFLTLFSAHELPGCTTIKAISSDGIRNRHITHLKNAGRISFNYSGHFQNCGFVLTDNPNWMSMPNSASGFYKAISGANESRAGLRNDEIPGFDFLIDCFRNQTDVRSGATIPISIASDTSDAELGAAIPAFSRIAGK